MSDDTDWLEAAYWTFDARRAGRYKRDPHVARFRNTTYEEMATVGGQSADEWRPGCRRNAPGYEPGGEG